MSDTDRRASQGSVMQASVTPRSTSDWYIPQAPTSVEETGLEFGALADLALKAVYADAQCTTQRAAEMLKLSAPVTQEILQYLYKESFIEIRGMVTYGNDRYTMLDHGLERVHRLLDLNGYIGPAPVSLQAYSQVVRRQSEDRRRVLPETIHELLSHLVLPETTVETLGLVASSRRSLFMTGPAGNGKTTIATALHGALTGDIWIPYAIDVDGQIIKVFDTHMHQRSNVPPEEHDDQRWIRVHRPLIIVGGEMTIETMDLIYSTSSRFYEAPFQVKANGGTLVIDDFGRQRVDPTHLLNRWIIPLEERVDYLTLHTGKKIEVPFEQLLIFSTNLDPDKLVDEAFLRRMGYRLYVGPPTPKQYTAIYRAAVAAAGFEFHPSQLEFLIRRYEEEKRPLRGCEPGDLIERCTDICRYEGRPNVIDPELLDLAWKNYFGTREVGAV